MRMMRKEREAKAKRLNDAKEAFFNHQGPMPTSKGYAKPKELKLGHAFHIHFSPLGGNSHASQSLTGKQKTRMFKIPDHELYAERLVTKGGHDKEAKVRVGTIPSHGAKILDKETGEERYIKVPSKPRYAVVGQQGNTPKDGGK